MLRPGEDPHHSLDERSVGAEQDQGSAAMPVSVDSQFLWPNNVVPWEYDPQMQSSSKYHSISEYKNTIH